MKATYPVQSQIFCYCSKKEQVFEELKKAINFSSSHEEAEYLDAQAIARIKEITKNG